MPARALLAVAAAATLLSCGKSAEEERMEEVRRICEGLAPGTTTLQEAEVALRGGQFGAAWVCGSYAGPWGEPDTCDYGAQICLFDFAYYQGDPSACEQTLQGLACWYGCGLRASQADWSTNQREAIVCARRFYGPQRSALIPR